jgi:hypothetical protein
MQDSRFQDPFSISFDQFLKLDYRQSRALQAIVSEKFGPTLEHLWKSGVRQAVVCGNQIVMKTASFEDVPPEEAMKLAKQFDRACFVFSAPDLVEESRWSPVSRDDYPTLSLYVGTENAMNLGLDDKRMFSNIRADFDTGASGYRIFPAHLLPENLGAFSQPPYEAKHFDKKYSYFVKTARISVRTISGSVHSMIAPIRIVEEWAGCALLEVSPSRTGYVGRTIIRNLQIKLELDPTANRTRILEP